jgi:hypothetical protein
MSYDLDRVPGGSFAIFVPDEMFVIAAIHQSRAICGARTIDLRGAIGVILRHGSGRDDNETVTGVTMPAAGAAGRPGIGLDVQV